MTCLRSWRGVALVGGALLQLALTGCDADPPPMMDAGPPPDPTVLEVRFAPEETSFWRTPWPSDARLTPAGTPDLSGFPSRRRLLDTTLSEIEGHVHGFATMPVVYFSLSAAVSDETLRQGLDATAEDSPLQLVDLSEDGCGARIPLEVSFAARGDALRPDNALQLANAIGTVLEPGRPYGAIVLRRFGAEDGRETLRPEAFDAALADASGADALARSLEPLRRCLPMAGVPLDEVAVATVFTPHDPVAELRALRDFVADPSRAQARAPSRWRVSEGWSRRNLRLRTFVATGELPIFQDGETPYELEGGRLIFDDAGEPVIQRWEEVEIAVALRTFETPPEGPRPVMIFADGTGWRPWNHLRDNLIREALDAGYVVFAFMPQFHGGRAGFDANTEIATFNIPNPPAARANFRQQAAETSFFVRLIRERLATQPGMPEIDTDAIVYGGHSQGALVGALLAGVETEISAYFLNGLSAYLTETILNRQDILDFRSVVGTLYNFLGELDRWHPLTQMIQLGAEVVDPHNYARRWHGDAERPRGNHVFVSNGYEDDTTTPRGMEHVTMAGDMSPIAPPGWEVDPVGVWDGAPVSLPVMGNDVAFSGDPLTIATFLDFDQGHFTVYRRPFVRQLASTFWRTAREGVPALSSAQEFQCGDGADEDLDGMLDCDDPDCAARPPCVEGPCDNGEDEDGDGLTDCADPACEGAAACREQVCDDATDDDGDGMIDCLDSDCAASFPCVETRCADGLDDDGDGAIDCLDSDCAGDDACFESSCSDGADNDGDGAVDCADSECAMSLRCPERVCDDGVDQNGDGLFDCADPGCALDPACAVTEEASCTNGLDDDGDGAADCGDADCALEASCAAVTCADGDLGRQLGPALWVGRLGGRPNGAPPGDCTPLGRGDETPDVSFLWTAPATGTYVFSTYGSRIDTVLSVTGPDCDPVTELECNDNARAVRSSVLELTLEADQAVVVVINAIDEDDVAGDVLLHIYARP